MSYSQSDSGSSNKQSLREIPIAVLGLGHVALSRLRRLMELPVLVDGRNLNDPGAARQAGFEYVSVGCDGAIHPVLESSGKTKVGRKRLLAVSKQSLCRQRHPETMKQRLRVFSKQRKLTFCL
jgi:hypothetical protein